MRTIWKYPLKIIKWQEVELSLSAYALSAQFQSTVGLVLWAVIDPDARKEVRHIYLLGTGHVIEEERYETLVFIDTVQDFTNGLVWHVFIN